MTQQTIQTRKTPAQLAMHASFRQRSLTALASLAITFAVFAGNLQLAQGYADATQSRTDTAQATQPVRG